MKYLLVVAHPDDEVLGAGGTIYKLTSAGHEVDLCVLSGNAAARNYRPSIDDLKYDMGESSKVLGIKEIIEGQFPNIEFNNVPHLMLVQFIEKAIMKFEPDIIITHHPADLNNDHLHTSIACQAAIRLFQRKPSIKPVNELLFMEIISSTEWNVNSGINSFEPNTFFEIGTEGLDKKIQALQKYRGVMRDFPHPRSKEVITGLSAYRGGQSGLKYAEAFQVVFRRIVTSEVEE
ncbi:MAG: PIG-L family deacetylase [Firmicutes bacterium]|nr:PIG-L family deacetylase [Bacillota bacterium]